MLPRCECVPLPGHQVSLRIDGVEKTRWHFGPEYPRPFFWPFIGPGSGESLTRMGHPGAPNHDHHRSIWFAHAKLQGVDFWSETSKARIEQQEWLLYEDSDDEAQMAVRLQWRDGHDAAPLLDQDVIAGLRPLENGEYLLDLQTILTPRAGTIELQKSNFGLLAVRVARSLSTHFGGGTLTNSEGKTGEPEIFGKPARWVDYTGPIRAPRNGNIDLVEGITYFSHPSNAEGLPKWHVRADGWMGCSLCFDAGQTISKEGPLVLRYLLHSHRDRVDAARTEEMLTSWTARPPRAIVKSMKPNRMYELVDDPEGT